MIPKWLKAVLVVAALGLLVWLVCWEIQKQQSRATVPAAETPRE